MIARPPEFLLPSSSKLDLAAECPASFALPQTQRNGKYSTRGRALHAYLGSIKELGREKALEQVPAEWREDAEVIDVDALPLDIETYHAEVTIAFNLDTGGARVLGQGMKREEVAALLRPREIAGTLDVLGLTADAVVVPDYKTGHAHLVPREMRQLKSYSLFAARAFNRLKAISGVIRIREDGTNYWQRADFDAFDLDAFELEVKEICHRVLVTREQLSRGISPATNEGEHCRNCNAFDRCPSKMSLVRAAAGAPDSIEEMLKGATPEQLSVALQRVNALEKVVERVKGVLRDRALLSPIPLPDGRVFGPGDQDEVNLDLAHKFLTDNYGPTVAADALQIEKSMSKDSIEKAMRAQVLKPGMRIGKFFEQLWAELRKAGGLSPVTVVKARHPKKEEAKSERHLQLVGGSP
jgi:hypothetical protein